MQPITDLNLSKDAWKELNEYMVNVGKRIKVNVEYNWQVNTSDIYREFYARVMDTERRTPATIEIVFEIGLQLSNLSDYAVEYAMEVENKPIDLSRIADYRYLKEDNERLKKDLNKLRRENKKMKYELNRRR